MPIRKSDYHPKWSLISYLIRVRRAKNICERCGIQNGRTVRRQGSGRYTYATACELMRYRILREVYGWRHWRTLRYLGLTRVILTVAHVDRDRTNNRFDNLQALCQRCHLVHDKEQHIRNRSYGRYHDREQQLQLPL
jgi:hypothetical protein